jgi:chromosome segregation ATPase
MKLLFALASTAVASKIAVTAVLKVVEMMSGVLEKGTKEKHVEQVQFAAYKQFCDDTQVEKKRAIEEAEEKIEILKADIEKATATAEKLTKEIGELDSDISTWEGDMKAATKVREVEKADYDAMHADYSESVDALERAIAVLKKQQHDRAQAELLQVTKSSLVPDDARNMIQAFIEQDPEEGLAVSAPEANAYEGRSGGIIDMLDKLLDKFIEERTQLEKEEMNSKHAYDMLMQDLKAQTDQAQTDRDQKAENKAQTLQAKADAKGDLEDTTSTREADKKYVSDLSATCEQKSSDFESRQQLRAEEIEAIEKAIEIISANVAGKADKHLPGFVQTGKSFAQLRAVTANDEIKDRVASFLAEKAQKIGSRVLSALAMHAQEDPFAKVKKMIKELIVKLMEEANEEAEHKGWCDTELSTNEQTRKEKTSQVEELTANVDELQSSIAKLTEDIAELTKAFAELDAAVAKATQLRNEEKAKNEETIQDAQEAQTAVAQALTVLKEFYAKAAESTAFVQVKQEPEIFDDEYKGMQASGGGVVGMLEVIESDFARLEADTKASEASAQKEYDEFMTDSEVDKTKKTTDIEHKTAKKEDEEGALVTTKEDLHGTQKELDAALAYFDKLKPSCVDAGVSYEDRVARRKEEIESLQEALKILNGEDVDASF